MPEKKSEIPIQILKTGTCPTLTGKATLRYHVGMDPDSTVYLRVSTNSGGGFFNHEWVKLEDIQKVLEKHPEDQPITSVVLYPLFRGKSVNTPSFLLAVLKHEKLLQTVKGKRLRHELAGDFAEKLRKLSMPTGKAKKPARTTRKKAPAKKSTAKRRNASRKKASAARGT